MSDKACSPDISWVGCTVPLNRLHREWHACFNSNFKYYVRFTFHFLNQCLRYDYANHDVDTSTTINEIKINHTSI